MTRTLSLCLAAALGATLIAPAAPALASDVAQVSPGPACPAANLSGDQLGALIERIDTATNRKAKAGARLSLVTGIDDLSIRMLMIMDGSSKRTETVISATDFGTFHSKQLGNGHGYQYVTSASANDKPVLGVMHRSSGWLNTGIEDSPWGDVLAAASGSPAVRELTSATSRLTAEDLDGSVRGLLDDPNDTDLAVTCSASEAGLVIKSIDSDSPLFIRTDADLALLRFVIKDEEFGMAESIAYGAQPVADIPHAQRISPTGWGKAAKSAGQRDDLLTWGKITAGKAKRHAAKLHRSVRPADVRAAARKWPLDDSLRITINSGVLVAMKDTDAYTGKRLQVKLSVSDRKVKVAHNW